MNYRQILEAAPVAMLVADKHGRIKLANRQAERMFGCSPQELMGRSMDELLPERLRQAKASPDFFSRTSWKPGATLNLTGIRKDGVEFPFQAVLNRAEEGDEMAVIACLQDVTSQGKSEEAGDWMQDFCLSLLDKLPNPVWRSGVDGKCDYFNRAWLKFTGRSLSEEIGDGWLERVYPADRECVTETYLEAFHSRRPFQMQYRLIRHDGEVRWILDYGRPFKGSKGQFAGFIGAAFDITDRVHSQKELCRQRSQLLESQKIGKVGSWEWDILKDEVTWTDELYRIFGLKPEQFDGTFEGYMKWVHPEDGSMVRKVADEVLRTHSPFKYECRMIRPDGSEWFQHTRGEVVLDETGRPVRMVGVAQDITERKEAEERLEVQAQHLRELTRRLIEVQEIERRRLAVELHDDLGQTLTLLKLNLELAGENMQNITKAKSIVDDLVGRIRSISHDLRPSMLDDLGLLPALLSLAQRYLAQARFQLDFWHEGLAGRRFPPEVETAAYRIVQEALNNVVRHSGVLAASLRIWVDRDVLRLRIADTGCGFDPEMAMRKATVGLSGMRERVELLGGRLMVQSSPGAGTLVSAELPIGGRSGGEHAK